MENIMGLFFLRFGLIQQRQRLGHHVRRFQVDQKLRQLAIHPFVVGRIEAAQFLCGQPGQLGFRFSLANEAQLDEAELVEFLGA